MKEVSLEESKKICFEILQYFDNFCRKNDIKYSLGEGTLLGAVRHKGFIPWDDDIDLLMERKEIDKFVELYKEGPYKLFVPGKHKDWWSGVVRLTDTRTHLKFKKPKQGPHGLWIALTPIDHAPDDEKGLQMMKQKSRKWIDQCKRKIGKKPYPHTRIGVYQKITHLFRSINSLNNNYIKTMSAYNSIQTKRMQKIRLNGDLLIFPSEIMSGYTELEFEGQKFMAISHYDEYLRIMYGDYMKLPPKEERIPKHDFKAFYIE